MKPLDTFIDEFVQQTKKNNKKSVKFSIALYNITKPEIDFACLFNKYLDLGSLTIQYYYIKPKSRWRFQSKPKVIRKNHVIDISSKKYIKKLTYLFRMKELPGINYEYLTLQFQDQNT